jgi:ABC-type multidrug transport system fused ATPase/permease subunit
MKLQFTARKNLSAATDRRIKATNELFGAIRVIKFMGWERSFVAAVLKYRDIELGFLRRIQYFRVASSLIVGAVPMLINATVFILYHVTGHTLTPEMVFPVLALLNILRMPFMVIPWMFNLIVTSLVAVNRLNRFLNADDLVTVIRELDAEAEVEIAAQANADGAAGTDPEVEAYSALVTHANLAAYQSVELKERRNVVPGVMSRIKSAVCCCIPKKSKQQKADDAAKQEKSGGAEDKKFHTVAEKELLHDISAAIPKGKLTVVVGATGSGKTLFLEGLLGHLTVSKGTIASSPSMAYVPQQAWIMNGTVEDNVVFFEKKNQERFDAAATACCLDADLEQLADGSNTEIGERGVNLSGGQRARISLARAVYADRAMYLLDDPLSAVDAHVSKSLVEGCFCGTLAGKTRVLVTHQHYVLPRADRVIAMVDGRVGFQGTYREYRTWATEQRLLTPLSTTTPKAAAGSNGASGMMGEPTNTGGEDSASASMSQQHTMDLPLPDDEHPDAEEDKAAEGEPKKEEAVKDADKNKGALMSQEERAQGNVPLSMYKRYLRSCGGWARCAFILVVYTLTECINAAVQVWLAIWASGTFELERDTYLYVYLGIVLTSAMCGGIRAYVIYDTGRKASRSLHHDLLESVSAARVSFFDTTPLGRILNRFSKDIDTADNDLPMNYSGFLSTLFSITSSIAIMVVSQPFVIVALIPAGYVYSRVLVFYNAANREIKRVDSINKSPVFALLSEALEGAKTIAAFGKWNNVIAEACHRVDAVFSTSYLQQVVNRWLGLRLDTLGSAIVSVIAFAGVILTMHDIGGLGQHVGMLSLGLTLAMSVTTSLNWFVRQSASVEAGMNSIERIIFYSDDVETEDFRWYGDAGKTNPLPSLPIAKHLLEQQKKTASKKQAVPAPGTDAVTDLSQLGVEFKNVQLRYRAELPLVLKGVDFKIQPRQKVGIVGRTGSGKSTTLLAFLRIVETAGGSLEIGGKPHDAFALEHLRSLFAMIPQEPILFEGTIKSNLDPFDEASPAELKKALDQTNMWARVDKEGGPDKCDVAEGGKNFSVGQRQLLCMARALLKPATAFILMDEATANIDPENDKIIQETIRTAFASRTVITIAHRLATVIDSDQIVVMDAGVAAEVGAPKDLVEVEGGLFRSMIEALPKKEQARLLESARRGRVIDDAEVAAAAGGGFDERKPSDGSDLEE